MSRSWYPGNMAKTKKIIKENLNVIDAVIEVVDARIPKSSSNPSVKDLIGKRHRIMVLNKKDLADENITKEWVQAFKEQDVKAFPVNSVTGDGMDQLLDYMGRISSRKSFRQGLRFMILGIPNVGKSTLINRIAGKKIAKTGNKPGITRGKQWIKLKKGFRLLDTPGVLWPDLDDEETKIKLALIRGIKEDIMEPTDLAYYLVKYIKKLRPESLQARYEIDPKKEELDIIKQIGIKRGCLISGGEVDLDRTSKVILNDFHKGKMGGMSLEKPEKNA